MENHHTKHILFCHCGGDRISADLLSTVEEQLKKTPVRVTRISDLCGLVAHKKDQVAALINEDSTYLVIGCFLRSMNLLFEQVEKHTGKSFSFSHINMIETPADEVIRKIRDFCGDHPEKALYHELREGSPWPSWYPVIDYSRCTACRQCADFCLFGVYEKSENLVEVVNPQGCKNHCPACGRICPASAIVFPKYKHGGAIGGSDEIDEHAEQQRQSKDIQDILGNDLYAAMAKRKAKRQSIIREEAMKKARNERDNALKEMNN